MDDFVTIRSFSNSIDFEMVRTYLESFDVECFGQDEMSNRSFLPNANGGVKLQVRPEQVDNAVRLLKDGGYLKQEDMEPTPEFKWFEKLLDRWRKK